MSTIEGVQFLHLVWQGERLAPLSVTPLLVASFTNFAVYRTPHSGIVLFTLSCRVTTFKIQLLFIFELK